MPPEMTLLWIKLIASLYMTKTMTAGIRADLIFFLVFMINMSLATHMNIFREQFDNEDDEKTQRPIIGECGVGLKHSY